jgi:tRNA threonylcarbamoyladenosine biosynthesis protein TsaB
MPAPPPGGKDRQTVLGIETATPHGGVALCRGGVVLGEICLHNPRSHSEKLFPAIHTLLEMTGETTAKIAAVAVSRGPGSFTGLRIGVAAAKGLAFALKVPLFGIPTLELLAANAPAGRSPVCAVVDARRGEVFAALFKVGESGALRLREEMILQPEALAETIPSGTLVVGFLPAGLREFLEEKCRKVSFSPPHLNYPRASVTALQGGASLKAQHPSETDTLVPFYLRPSDAEANRAAKTAGGSTPRRKRSKKSVNSTT